MDCRLIQSCRVTFGLLGRLCLMMLAGILTSDLLLFFWILGIMMTAANKPDMKTAI